MAYTYMTAASSLYTSLHNTWTGGFQALVNAQFDNTFTAYQILEEKPFASGSYVLMDVRVNRAVDALTGQKLGDDYKTILFKNLTHATTLGNLYYFDNNYWLVTNTEVIKNLIASCMVRRCNNTLRWQDSNGGIHSVPCFIDYTISRSRDMISKDSPVTPAGYIGVTCQFNTTTNTIERSQRFLFGNPSNWVGYKILGGGIANYNNLTTNNNMSAGLLNFTMESNYENTDKDDLVNGIANVNQYVYNLTLSSASLTNQTGQASQLIATVTLNNDTVSRTVFWNTSSSQIATCASGLVSMIAAGSCIVTGSLANNSDVFDSCSVIVSASSVSNYEIIVNPDINYILESQSGSYTTYLYLNSASQVDAFTYAISGSVPTNHYIFTSGSNSFIVTNIEKYLTYPMIITCTSGSFSKVVQLNLRGSW